MSLGWRRRSFIRRSAEHFGFITGKVEEIIIDEDMRQELLLDLIAIEDTHPLSAGLQDLREAAGVPIVTESPNWDDAMALRRDRRGVYLPYESLV